MRPVLTPVAVAVRIAVPHYYKETQSRPIARTSRCTLEEEEKTTNIDNLLRPT